MNKIRFDNNIYFADFETLTINSKDYKKLRHTDIFLWYLKNIDGDYEKLGTTMDEFFNWCLDDNKNKIIYFHNLSFDGDFIFKYLLRKYPKLYLTPLEENKAKLYKKWFRLFNNGNKIYSLEFNNVIYDKNKNKKNVRVMFLCTYNLLSSSINSLGKSLGMNKLNEIEKLINDGVIKNAEEFYSLGGFKMNKKVKEAFIKYIKNDVEIARVSYINFKNNLDRMKDLTYSKKFNKSICDLKKVYTIGSLVYKISKNSIYNNFGDKVLKKYRIQSKDYDFARNWFYGGWTQYNPKYWNKWLTNLNGIVVDINSSYPNQMTKLLPVGALHKYVSPKWKNFLTYYKIKVKEAKIKKEYENFIILKNWKKEDDYRYVKELKDFECFYTEEEFKFLQKVYDFDIEYIDCYFCEAEYILKDLIEKLYYYKNYYAKLGQEANKLTYKIMLNSLYGRQCKRKIYDVVMWCDKKMYDEIKKTRNRGTGLKIGGKKYFIKSFKNIPLPLLDLWGVNLEPVINDNQRFSNILIGAQITSYARLQLWNAIFDIGVEKFIYCDTDSIFFNTDEDISKKIHLDKYELGCWDVECRFKEGKVLGAKRYAFIKEDKKGIKFAMSGINNIDFEDYNIDEVISDNNVLSKAQKYIIRDNYGILIDKRDFLIKKGKN